MSVSTHGARASVIKRGVKWKEMLPRQTNNSALNLFFRMALSKGLFF
jgi:hypothetical protein